MKVGDKVYIEVLNREGVIAVENEDGTFDVNTIEPLYYISPDALELVEEAAPKKFSGIVVGSFTNYDGRSLEHHTDRYVINQKELSSLVLVHKIWHECHLWVPEHATKSDLLTELAESYHAYYQLRD